MTAPAEETPLFANLRSAVAAELTTLPTYLYAYWSVTPLRDGGSAGGEAARTTIMSVVLEEMLHFGLSSNILNALGGTADFITPPYAPVFPCNLLRSRHHDPPGWGPVVRLLPLSADAVELFMQIELPAWDDPGGPTLGEFYDEYVSALLPAETADYRHGRQLAPWDNPGAGQLLSIACRADADRAITEILDQGEGLSSQTHNDGDHELAHYWKFDEIRQQIADAQIDLGRDVYPVIGDPSTHLSAYTADQVAANTAFNRTYTALLLSIQAALYSASPDLFPAATNLMGRLGQQAAVLRNLGAVPGTEKLAGPTFEFVGQGP
jgi:hypothetical protein